jgi:hypothetical protein
MQAENIIRKKGNPANGTAVEKDIIMANKMLTKATNVITGNTLS